MRPPGTEAWVATAGTESFSSGDGLRKGGWFRNAAVIYLHLSGHQFGEQRAGHVAGCFGAGARTAARRGIRLGARLLRRGPGRRGGRPPGELPQDPGPERPLRRARELSHLAVRGGAAHRGGAVAPGRAPATAAARRPGGRARRAAGSRGGRPPRGLAAGARHKGCRRGGVYRGAGRRRGARYPRAARHFDRSCRGALGGAQRFPAPGPGRRAVAHRAGAGPGDSAFPLLGSRLEDSVRTMRMSLVPALALLAVAAVGAQQSPPPQPGQPPEDPLGRVLFPPELVMQHQQEIGLRPEQRATITKAIQDFQTRVVDLPWRMAEQSQRLTTLLDKPVVDQTAALAQVDELLGVEREVKRSHLTLLIQIKNALSAEQQAKLSAARVQATR